MHRPASSFEISNLLFFFSDAIEHRSSGSILSSSGKHFKGLRDLIVDRAKGLKGVLSASTVTAGVDRQKTLNYALYPSSSRLGAGALDDDEELMGTHHIERILHEALRDGVARYQFPPTLNSYQ